MKDPFQKRIELWFRRMLIQLLGGFFQRKNILQRNIDFNTCKFLFIRQDRIGDVLISTPLFGVLKKHYPHAILDVLLSESNHFVLKNDPLIHTRWLYKKKIRNIISLIRALRNERYDFVIDLMDNPSTTSTVICLLINAKWNVGIDKNNRYVYDVVVPMLSRRESHIIDRIAQLLTPFQIDPQTEKFSIRYSISSQSEEFADRFIRQNNMSSHPIIGVNISAGSDVRFWGVENFKGLLNHLSKMYPEYKSLLLYHPSDTQRAHMIAETNQNVVLSPETSSFDQFAAFVKRLTFLITPDTAAVHLASAFHVGTVVLYVQSDKSLRIWEPYGTDYECIITDVDDLSIIPIEQVQDALGRLIQRSHKKTEIGV